MLALTEGPAANPAIWNLGCIALVKCAVSASVPVIVSKPPLARNPVPHALNSQLHNKLYKSSHNL